MELIKWEEKLSVQVPSIDNEHKKLINLINELHQSMARGDGKKVIGDTLSQLTDYTKAHFAHEEQLMRKANFKLIQEHISEHQKLTNQVIDLQKKHASGEMALTIQVMQFLKEWLTHHILETDKKYTKDLLEHGIN